MGWYTTNTDDSFQWKYGDVVALARGSGVGRLDLIPRVKPLDEDDEIFDGEEFLGPIQRWVLKKKLPWKNAIPFDPRSPGGECVRVPNDADVLATLENWARVLRANRKSLVAALSHFNGVENGQDPFARLFLTCEVGWTVSKRDYGALLRWLNEPLARKKLDGGARFSLEGLRAGTLDDDGYEPGDATKAALSLLPRNDRDRPFAAHALGHALVSDTPLDLTQPDDEFEVDVWDTSE